MSDPASTTTAMLAAALLPGIHGDALIGAVAGGTLFVIRAQELKRVSRLVHLAISVAIGYLVAEDIRQQMPVLGYAAAAFLASALAVTVATEAIERVKNFKFSSLFQKSGA